MPGHRLELIHPVLIELSSYIDEKLAKRKADTGGEDPNAPDADDKSKAAASRLGLTPEELAARSCR
eukprot:4550037-Amphidinium_carterae.1